MFANKIRDYKDTVEQSKVFHERAERLYFDLNKSIKSTFKQNMRRKVRKPVRVKFSPISFGEKKNNQDAAIIWIESVNKCVATVDNEWFDEQTGRVVSGPFTVEWFANFLLEQSEKLYINFKLRREKVALPNHNVSERTSGE